MNDMQRMRKLVWTFKSIKNSLKILNQINITGIIELRVFIDQTMTISSNKFQHLFPAINKFLKDTGVDNK